MNADMIGEMLAKFGSLWPSAILVLVALGVLLYFKQHEKAKLGQLAIKDIDRLDMDSFEKHLALLFKQQGFSLLKEKDGGKFAADFIAKSQNKRMLIHVLRKRTGKFGVKDVLDAAAAQEEAGCDEVMLVTNGFFTKDAPGAAADKKVTLWDQKRLIEELATIKPER